MSVLGRKLTSGYDAKEPRHIRSRVVEQGGKTPNALKCANVSGLQSPVRRSIPTSVFYVNTEKAPMWRFFFMSLWADQKK
jgi:hypothetical protein